MTQCARSRPLQSVRQAAIALPTQSPSCQRQLAPSPHMLTASLPGGLHPFGAGLLLLEQGSKGTRRAGRVRQLTNKKLLCYSLPLLPPKAQRECGRGKRCSSARSSSMALPGSTASRTTPGHPFMEV